MASADAGQIERAVANLLTNALKYSPPSMPVVVRVRRGDTEGVVTVADRGVGILLAEQGRNFERFARVEANSGTSMEGLGLELYIARLIVEAHGGHIWVKSEVGAGSTFGIAAPHGGSGLDSIFCW